MNRFYRSVRRFLTVTAKGFFHLTVKGTENMPEDGGVVLCCNHTSLTDIWLLIVACPRHVYFMAKEELFRHAFTRSLFSKMGAFPVRRGASDLTAVRRSLELVRKGKVLGIFPEGTRHKEGPPHHAKPGAALIALQSKATILPAAIVRYGRVRLWQKTTVHFGTPISYNAYCADGKADKAALTALTERISGEMTALWEAGQ